MFFFTVSPTHLLSHTSDPKVSRATKVKLQGEVARRVKAAAEAAALSAPRTQHLAKKMTGQALGAGNKGKKHGGGPTKKEQAAIKRAANEATRASKRANELVAAQRRLANALWAPKMHQGECGNPQSPTYLLRIFHFLTHIRPCSPPFPPLPHPPTPLPSAQPLTRL